MPIDGQISIRHATRADMEEMVRIDAASYSDNWYASGFIRCMQCRNSYVVVCEAGKELLGYCAYYYFKNAIQIERLAVEPLHRREMIGSFLIDKLLDKLVGGKYCFINIEVRESNLLAQLFLKSMGFKANKTIHKFYENNDEDAYQFTRGINLEPSIEMAYQSSKKEVV